MINLINYRVDEISLKNSDSVGGAIELSPTANFELNLQPTGEGSGILTIEVVDRTKITPFRIFIRLIGIFTSSEGVIPSEQAPELFQESYKELFLYGRTMLTMLTANAGMQPLILPFMPMGEENKPKE